MFTELLSHPVILTALVFGVTSFLYFKGVADGRRDERKRAMMHVVAREIKKGGR